MVEENVYISFRKKGSEKPWKLLRITEPVQYAHERSVEDSPDSCAVDAGRAPFYLEKLTEKGYETTVTQLDQKTRGVYVVKEWENLADIVGFKPSKEDKGYTADLQPPRRR